VVFLPSRFFDVDGSLSERKRPLSALRAFRRLLDLTEASCQLVAIAPPGFLPPPSEEHARITVARVIATLGLQGNVRLLNMAADDAMMNRLYNMADVTLIPSIEGFGLVYLESIASGTPVVTVDDGASREVLGASGTYVRDDCMLSDNLGHAMWRLQRQPTELARLRIAAVNQFDTSFVPDHWPQHLDEVLREAFR
jgi:glycosyltransferase involved in cell wall biosynthesis